MECLFGFAQQIVVHNLAKKQAMHRRYDFEISNWDKPEALAYKYYAWCDGEIFHELTVGSDKSSNERNGF